MMGNLSMFLLMMSAALLSTMNIWADKWNDMRLSLNDWYMAFLMTGWMFLLMGLYYELSDQIMIGLPLIIISFLLIRNQTFITQNQYVTGMIPHHSMAVHMSKKLLERPNVDPGVRCLAESIVRGQTEEIELLKSL